MIIYNIETGAIIAAGEIIETDTHFVKKDLYIDKQMLGKVDGDLDEREIGKNIIKNGAIIKKTVTIYSKAEFALLFTPAEFKNMKISTDERIEYFMTIMLDLVKEIDLEDYNTFSALQYFKVSGVISASKIDNILSGISPKYNIPGV